MEVTLGPQAKSRRFSQKAQHTAATVYGQEEWQAH